MTDCFLMPRTIPWGQRTSERFGFRPLWSLTEVADWLREIGRCGGSQLEQMLGFRVKVTRVQGLREEMEVSALLLYRP
ncbi:hypothetical protein RRG08_041185 [Elysia crispata]|uniref:Uncharacterized protein n=1 Tax=Elysia crispata TaxID=231223 RepID=A0AAE0XXS8_9GAST|nr:hypothetical protein RRG08_041185 [Elysia crispata]